MGVYVTKRASAAPAINATSLLYTCPSNKSYASVDVLITKPSFAVIGKATIALAEHAVAANLTSLDHFLEELNLDISTTSASLKNIIVGPNESLFVRSASDSGVWLAARAQVTEISNSKVLDAGRLAVGSLATLNTNVYIFQPTNANLDYSAVSLTVYNPNASATEIQVYCTPNTTGPVSGDYVALVSLEPKESAIIDGLKMAAGENITLRTSTQSVEYFINGLVMRT